MGTPRDSVLIGVITGAHGIRGEVKLKSFTAEPASIARYGPLQSSSGKQIEISKLKAAKDGFIASLKSVSDRNEAEALNGVELFVAREKLPKLKTHEAYVHDLIGLAVVLAMARHWASSSHAKLRRRRSARRRRDGNSETVLIPFTDAFVPEEDFSSGRIIGDLAEGLSRMTG